ncbi:MAG: FHA domain-containing protein [Phototrophicaceae bacterium]
MKMQIFIMLLSCVGVFFLSGCGVLDSVNQVPDVSQFQNNSFYAEILVTVELMKIPIILVAFMSLVIGWKIGRVGLAINAFVIAAILIYTYLGRIDFISEVNIKLGITIVSAIFTGILAYFLYNLMALIVGGIIGSILMNGAWFQAVEQVPPIILVFITTFVSALVMFMVFRLFLVAFSAIIGTVILMIAIPFGTFWVIPVAGFGILCQMVIAFLIKDDIFRNMKGDFAAALREAFGDVLGSFGVLRDRQKEDREAKLGQNSPKLSPESSASKRQPASQSSYPSRPTNQPQSRYTPQQPAQPYTSASAASQSPQPKPQSYPANASQQPSQMSVQHHNPGRGQTPSASTEVNLQRPTSFRPENFYFQLSTGATYSLPVIGSHLTVGRSPEASISVHDMSVSGIHLIIAIQEDGILVWDNQTTNGSLFNAQPLTGSAIFTPADTVKIGDLILRLLYRNFL